MRTNWRALHQGFFSIAVVVSYLALLITLDTYRAAQHAAAHRSLEEFRSLADHYYLTTTFHHAVAQAVNVSDARAVAVHRTLARLTLLEKAFEEKQTPHRRISLWCGVGHALTEETLSHAMVREKKPLCTTCFHFSDRVNETSDISACVFVFDYDVTRQRVVLSRSGWDLGGDPRTHRTVLEGEANIGLSVYDERGIAHATIYDEWTGIP